MESQAFDHLTRVAYQIVSRRTALRRGGVAALAAALSGGPWRGWEAVADRHHKRKEKKKAGANSPYDQVWRTSAAPSARALLQWTLLRGGHSVLRRKVLLGRRRPVLWHKLLLFGRITMLR